MILKMVPSDGGLHSSAITASHTSSIPFFLLLILLYMYVKPFVVITQFFNALFLFFFCFLSLPCFILEVSFDISSSTENLLSCVQSTNEPIEAI